MRCVLEPGDKIVDSPPTFTMYVFDAAVNAAEVVTVPRLPGFRIDVQGKSKDQEKNTLKPQFSDFFYCKYINSYQFRYLLLQESSVLLSSMLLRLFS